MPTFSLRERVKRLANRDSSAPDSLSEPELQDVIDRFPNIYSAAAEVCRIRAAYWVLHIDVSAAGVSYNAGARHDRLMAKAKEFEAMAASGKGGGAMSMYVGGASISDSESLDENTDLKLPEFRIDGDSYLGQLGPDHEDWRRGRG